ncbi:unnamed protein product [Amoebophrya sp. A25]|nr:unnamed protein product [Amoebophrya sp. A25]|eukprot:GSA25T00023237001.1
MMQERRLRARDEGLLDQRRGSGSLGVVGVNLHVQSPASCSSSSSDEDEEWQEFDVGARKRTRGTKRARKHAKHVAASGGGGGGLLVPTGTATASSSLLGGPLFREENGTQRTLHQRHDDLTQAERDQIDREILAACSRKDYVVLAKRTTRPTPVGQPRSKNEISDRTVTDSSAAALAQLLHFCKHQTNQQERTSRNNHMLREQEADAGIEVVDEDLIMKDEKHLGSTHHAHPEVSSHPKMSTMMSSPPLSSADHQQMLNPSENDGARFAARGLIWGRSSSKNAQQPHLKNGPASLIRAERKRAGNVKNRKKFFRSFHFEQSLGAEVPPWWKENFYPQRQFGHGRGGGDLSLTSSCTTNGRSCASTALPTSAPAEVVAAGAAVARNKNRRTRAYYWRRFLSFRFGGAGFRRGARRYRIPRFLPKNHRGEWRGIAHGHSCFDPHSFTNDNLQVLRALVDARQFCLKGEGDEEGENEPTLATWSKPCSDALSLCPTWKMKNSDSSFSSQTVGHKSNGPHYNTKRRTMSNFMPIRRFNVGKIEQQQGDLDDILNCEEGQTLTSQVVNKISEDILRAEDEEEDLKQWMKAEMALLMRAHPEITQLDVINYFEEVFSSCLRSNLGTTSSRTPSSIDREDDKRDKGAAASSSSASAADQPDTSNRRRSNIKKSNKKKDSTHDLSLYHLQLIQELWRRLVLRDALQVMCPKRYARRLKKRQTYRRRHKPPARALQHKILNMAKQVNKEWEAKQQAMEARQREALLERQNAAAGTRQASSSGARARKTHQEELSYLYPVSEGDEDSDVCVTD